MQISRRKRIWIVLAGLALFSWLAHSTYRNLAKKRAEAAVEASAGPLEVGMGLPRDLSFQPLSGDEKKAADLLGKVVILNFWASWCAPCVHEMPGLYALHKKLAARGFEVVALNMENNPEEAVKALERLTGKSAFPIYRGSDSPLADRFAVQSLPFTVILDRELKIQYAKAGEIDWQDPGIVSMIEKML